MSNDFKLIMENWNNYVDLVETDVDTNIYLMNEGKFEKSSFSLLLEQADQGIISYEQMYETWEKSFDYEMSLLEEQFKFMDKVKAGFDKTKQFFSKAAIKIRNVFFSAGMQLIKMIGRSLDKGLKTVAKFVGLAGRFARSVVSIDLKKLIITVACIIVLFLLEQILGSPEALAAMKGQGAEFTQIMVDTLKGATSELGRIAGERAPIADKFEIAETTIKAVQEIDALAKSPDVENVQDLKGKVGALIRQAYAYVLDLIQIIKDESLPTEEREATLKALKDLAKQGASTKVYSN